MNPTDPARPPPATRATARRIGRGLAWTAIVAAVLFFVHAAAAHWLLSTPTLRGWINGHPETTWIDWDEASSTWPGRVSVRGLRIRGSDRNVQWIFRLDEGRFRYSVAELLARRFHVLALDGSALSFRLRKNRKPGDPHPTPVSLQPPILGFADPPRAAATARAAGPRNPWTVRIDGIAIRSLPEIWVDMYRFEGNAGLRGAFRLRPGLEAEIGPATIAFDSGGIRLGSEPVLRLGKSRIGARFEPWDPRTVQGDAVWRSVTAEIDLSGEIGRLAFANYFLRAAPTPRLGGGSGPARIRARIDRGVARGDISVDPEKLDLRLAASSLSGRARVGLRIAKWDLVEGPVVLSSSRLELSRVSSEPDGSRDWWCRFAVPSGRLGDVLDARLGVTCRDARPLLSALGASIPKIARGILTLTGLQASARIRAGRGRAEIHDLDARGDRLHVEGEYRQIGHRQDGVFLLDAGKINVGVAVREGRSHLRPIATRRWFEKEREAIVVRDAPDAARQAARSSTTAVP